MKIIITGFFLAFVAVFACAQAPKAFNYQAVARGSNGQALPPGNSVGIRISILSGSPAGTEVYVETHTPVIAQGGLFTLTIGNGNGILGDFASIDWGNGNYFLHVEMDESGGSSYIPLGTTQLLSVPYALYAENAGNDSDNQNLFLEGNLLLIQNGNSVNLSGLVNDDDSDPTNELQALSINGDTLSISNGNSVLLPNAGGSGTANAPVYNFEYGENIAKGNAVAVGDGKSAYRKAGGGGVNLQNPKGVDGTKWLAQTFKTSESAKFVRAIEIVTNYNDSIVWAVSLRHVSNGVPIGNDLAGEVGVLGPYVSGGSGFKFHIKFENPVPVFPDSTYALIIRTLNSSGEIWSSEGLNPNQQVSTSNDSGTSWAMNQASELHFNVFEVITEPGKIYKTDLHYASNMTIDPNNSVSGRIGQVNDMYGPGDLQTNFIGFTTDNGILGETKPVQLGGIVSGFSNLNIGQNYRLATNAPGGINSTDNNKQVGIAINSNEILFRQDN